MPEVGEGRFRGWGSTTSGVGACFCILLEASEEGLSRVEGADAGGGGSACDRGARIVEEARWGSRSRGERGS